MGYKVLVVEDEDLIRRGLVYSVDWRAADCTEIREASDGQMAVEEIQTFRPDIVIMDINIPFLSGLDVLEQTQKAFGYSAIILTGYADFTYARRAVTAGVARFLLKPVDFDELAEALESAKESRQRRLAYDEYQRAGKTLKSLDLLSAVNRSDPVSEPVRRILAHIEAHYPEKITLHDLAGAFHYSESFLVRKFKDEMKLGCSEYLTRYRLQKAVTLLRETDKRVETIAEECGFVSAKYFNQVFRRHIGCSPREFSHISG